MNINGIIVGAAVFLIIGICHPIVIKLEYYYGKRSWWVMALAGTVFAGISLFVHNLVLSTILGFIAQEKRVLKGWFPENPKRHEYYAAKRKANHS